MWFYVIVLPSICLLSDANVIILLAARCCEDTVSVTNNGCWEWVANSTVGVGH